MVNEDEERYLRQSLLLLKGCRYIGLQVLHRVEQNEIQTTGKDLDRVLRDKEKQLRNKFSAVQQQEKLFPADGKTKCETWDIPMITGVLLKCFRRSLDDGDIEAVKTISYKRNSVYAHASSASLTKSEYTDVCQGLQHAMTILSGKSDQSVKDKCKDLIEECLTGPLESQKEEVRNVPEYDSLLKEILKKVESTETEVKGLRTDVTDLTAVVRRLIEERRDHVLKIKVIDSELEVSGKENEVHDVRLAEKILTKVVEEARKRVGSESGVNQIREAVDEILLEIEKTGAKVVQAEQKCVLIKLSCTSYSQILSLLNLLAEPGFQALLDRLAHVLTQHLALQHPLRLTFRISEISLRNLLKELDYQPAETHKRSIRLPIQCETIEDMAKLWKFFEEGGAARGLKKLSAALSEYLKTDISVTAGLNPEQVIRAIEDAEEMKDFSRPEKKADFSESVYLGSTEELVFCEKCKSNKKHIQASSFCFDCQENHCSDCVKVDNALGHLLLDKAQSFYVKKSAPVSQYNKCKEVCPSHRNEVIEYCCREHSEVGCKTCMALKHKSCSVGNISVICSEVVKSEELKKTVDEVEQNLSKLDSFEENVKRTKSENQSSLNKAIAELDHFQIEINRRIEELKRNMVHKAEELQEQNSKVADKVAGISISFYNSLQKIQSKLRFSQEKKQTAQTYTLMKQAQAMLKDYDMSAAEIEIAMQRTKFVFEANKDLKHILAMPDGLGKLSQQNDADMSKKKTASKEVKSLEPVTCNGNINVKTSSDKFKCSITGCDILSEDRVLLVDNKNKKVKILDIREREVVEERELDKYITLHDVAVLPNNQAFVTNPQEKKVLRLRTSGRLSVTGTIELGRECYGITYNQDTVYVVCWNPFSVLVLDLDGTIEKDISLQSTSISNPKYIAVDNAQRFLFVSGENCVVSINLGDESKEMRIETLQKPLGLSVLEDGSVVVCSTKSGCIHRISANLKQCEILKNDVPSAQSICYNKNGRQICVGCGDSDNVFCFVWDK